VVVVAVITASIIIVLSIFNGLGDLLRTLNDSFDPEIKIEAAEGKTFQAEDSLLKKIEAVPGVALVTEVIEDYAYARYNGATQVVMVKGVSDNFIEQNRIPKENIIEGEPILKRSNSSYALVGIGVQQTLSIAIKDNFYTLQLYYVKNSKGGSLDPSKLYTQKNIAPGGVFSIIQNFDENYVVVPLAFAEELMSYGNKRTSLEIKTSSGANIHEVEDKIQQTIGTEYNVLNAEEQHQDLYRVVKLEKLFASLAAILLLIIGSINIYFTLMMLALDKKKDISILSAVGADQTFLKKVFLAEGVLIALIGTGFGLFIGALIVTLQQQFGLVSMGLSASVVESYPVKMILSDFLYVLGIMSLVTILISSKPAVLAAKFASVQHL